MAEKWISYGYRNENCLGFNMKWQGDRSKNLGPQPSWFRAITISCMMHMVLGIVAIIAMVSFEAKKIVFHAPVTVRAFFSSAPRQSALAENADTVSTQKIAQASPREKAPPKKSTTQPKKRPSKIKSAAKTQTKPSKISHEQAANAAQVNADTADRHSRIGEAENQSDSRGSAIVIRGNPLLVNGKEIRVPYPERAKQYMIEGIVRLRLTVSEHGTVIDAKILSGPSFGLRGAALSVARKLLFLPATDEFGQARTAQVDHEVVFKLNRRS